MEGIMRADLLIGNKFPDIELPDTSGTVVKLSELMKGLPTVLTFNRGKY
jgi:peroxiredoxin